MEKNEYAVIDFLIHNPKSSSKKVHDGIDITVSYATVKRILSKLLIRDYIIFEGRGRGTKYSISPGYNLVKEVSIGAYFERELDEREIYPNFDLKLITETLPQIEIFNQDEKDHLSELQLKFETNIKDLPRTQYDKELERLVIDLSWKSSQIEGNTYSLLETERLIKEQKTAEGKHKDEATMLLNHKKAIDFIIENPDYIDPLVVRGIEDIHSLLMYDLGVSRNVRNKSVGISGTNYVPLDNEYQIREALQEICVLINKKSNIFEKAFLCLVLISYVQAFVDGNKRTARIISNSVLVNNGICPISFRTVDSKTYKEAMLIFYEKQNIYNMKRIFIDQFEFAVNTYF